MYRYEHHPRDRLLTVADFERLPEEDLYRVELVRGRIVREPLPGARHAWLSLRIGYLIQKHLDETGSRAFCGTDGGFVLEEDPDTVRGPDVFVVAEARAPQVIPAGFLRQPPDLAIEILSPSNRRREIAEKVADYLGAGAELVWVVNPPKKAVEVHRSGEPLRRLGLEDELEGGKVLPHFRLRVDRIFER